MGRLTDKEKNAIETFFAGGGIIAVCPTMQAGEDSRCSTAYDDIKADPEGTRGPEPRTVKRMGIREALEWAFRDEFARLTFDERPEGCGAGAGAEYVILRRALLGQTVDISRGTSKPADDAELVAAAVQGALSKSDAIWVADLARAGVTPDPMIGVVAKLVAERWQSNQHGWSPATSDAAGLGSQGWRPQPRRNKNGAIVYDQVRYTPCRWEHTPAEIATARRRYLKWIGHLMHVRAVLKYYPLRWLEVSTDMPETAPWRESS